MKPYVICHMTFTAGEIGDQIVNTLEQAAMRAQLQELGEDHR